MNFGENLKLLRKSKKISQESLAEKVGVSRQSVSKWETGESYPEMNHILELCKIFHCHINDFVNDTILDKDSLDEEVKMSVVKFKKEKQKKMKMLSKTISILSKIFRIFAMLGCVCIFITMIIVPIVASHIKLENNQIMIYDETVEYERSDDEIVFRYQDENEEVKEEKITEENAVKSINKAFLKLENNSISKLVLFIEFAFATLIVNLIMIYFVFRDLDKLFMNIHRGDTPFTLDNVFYIKRMSYLLIAIIIIPVVMGLLSELIFHIELGIEIDFVHFIEILFLFSMAYIFEYGYEIQLDSKGKLYGD